MKVSTTMETWNTKQGKSVRIVTRGKGGKFYDNISLASLI
jgi:hypothetical protein